jgi:two-component system sensor histidine kinase HydH
VDARLLIRLVLPTAGVGVLLLAVGLLAGWYVHRLQRQAADALGLNVASVRAAERLEITVRKIQTLLYQHRTTGQDRSEYLSRIPPLVEEAAGAMAEAEELATTPAEKELTTRARAGFERFRAEFDWVNGPVDPAARTGVVGVLDRRIEDEILPPVHEYLELNEAAAAAALRENQAEVNRLVPALVMLAACGSTGGLLTGFALARGVARSLVQLSIPVRDAAGQLGRVVGPITVSSGARVADLEHALQRLAAEVGTVVGRLQEAEREVLRREQLAAVGQLAAGVAHELRNPLTAIKVLVQAAARRPGEPVLEGRNLTVLREEIDRLEGTIQALLDFARPPRPEKRPVAADAVVRDTLGLVAARAEQQGVRLAPDLPSGPAWFDADPAQLRQLVLNLVLNALDATPAGGTVEVRLRTDEPGWLVLEVADTGPGLPAGLGERIFEPFVSTKETGTGLGLSICRRVAESHGGTIVGANRPDGGAVFTVRLPAGR